MSRDPRVNGLAERVDRIERELDAGQRRFGQFDADLKQVHDDVQKLSHRESFLKRHAYLGTWINASLGGGFVVCVLFWIARTVIIGVVDERFEAKLAPFNTQLARHEALLKEQSQAISRVEGRLEGLSALLAPLVLNQLKRVSAGSPTDSSNQQSAKILAAALKNAAVPLPEDAIREAGMRFLEAGAPSAWEVGIRFLEYKTNLNIPTPSIGKTIKDAGFQNWIVTIKSGNPPQPNSSKLVSYWDTVPAVDAAVIGPIGDTRNRDLSHGPGFFKVEAAEPGARMMLDGQRIRRAIFVGLEVIYDGGPVQLEDVWFVNCTFRIKQVLPSISLAKQLLTSPSVSLAVGD